MTGAGEIPLLLLAFAVGVVLASVHFTGLWLTVKRLPSARRPLVLALSSHFLRLAVTLAGFFLLVMGGHWARLAAGLVGFIVCRVVLTRIWGPRVSEGKV